MDELAIIRLASTADFSTECDEPIAEHNFNRKKMLQLEQGIGSLQKAARQHYEVVSQLESGMKAMISETDLRRAIGLAFQEFENRLEDSFQDSNRKCLSMFSRRDEVQELQDNLGKKVSWAEYNAVLKKLADLRQYVDTMADSIFIGHIEALKGEFGKKADKEAVEQALKLKADSAEVDEVRARFERLEVLVAVTDARQTAALEALRGQTEERRREQAEKHLAMIRENVAAVADLRTEHAAVVKRLGSAEAELAALGAASGKLREVQQVLKKRQDEEMMPAIAGAQEQLQRIEAAASKVRQDVRTLEGDAAGFRDSSQRTVRDLTAQVKSNKEHVEFLLQEADMIKRRAKEMAKKHTATVTELADEKEKLAQQLQAVERDVKRQSRDVRAIENRAAKAGGCDDGLAALAGLRALPAPTGPEPGEPNERLRGLLDQLERLGAGGPPHEQLGVSFNPDRPPLPIAAGLLAVARQAAVEGDFTARLPRFNTSEPAPIDTARAGYSTSATVGGMYGLSPRQSPGGTNRAGKKKR